MSTLPETAPSGRLAALALSGTLAVLTIAATASVEIPAMVDYLNHLARMELLADGRAHPAYESQWAIIPNLAMDILVPPLAHFMGAAAATKLFLIFSQILMVTGAMALERVVKGATGFAGVCAVLALFTTPVAWGLLNFTFGLGVAVWGLAAWIALWERPRLRWGVHWAIVLALFVGHMFALGLYGFALGLYELARNERPPRGLVLFGLALASPVGVLLALVSLSGGAIGTVGLDWDFTLKGRWPYLAFNVYYPLASALTAVALGGLAVALAASGSLRLSREGVWIGVGLLILYLLLPRRLVGTAYLDVRVITASLLFLPAFCRLTAARSVVVAALFMLAVANGALTFNAWRTRQLDYAQVRSTFPLLQHGAAVLIARRDDRTIADVPLYYSPTLAVPAASVFVSSFYAVSGTNPVAVRPAYLDLKVVNALDYVPPTVAQLVAPAAPHLQRWLERYQYIYVIGEPGVSPAPDRLTRIAVGARFTLYRIAAARGG